MDCPMTSYPAEVLSLESIYQFCDDCGVDITANGWYHPTGRVAPEDNAPVVELFCERCHFDALSWGK